MAESVFAPAFRKYAEHLRALGYKPEEVTLMMIGFAAGWNEYEQALDRLAKAIKEA